MTDNAWRGVEGLTPPQVAQLNEYRRQNVMPDAELLGLARSMVADNLLDALHGDVAPPADAVAVDDWFDMGDDTENHVIRTWTGRSWELGGDGRVAVSGVQDQTGATTRGISIELPGGGDEMTVEQARDIAAALLAAIAEVGRINDAEGRK